MQHASGMPCTLPLGELSGVFMSACASIQIRPIFSPRVADSSRHARHGAHRHGVIAAQHQRQLCPSRQRRFHHLRQTRAGLGDLRQITGIFVQNRQAFRLLHLHIAEILNSYPSDRDPLIQPGEPQRRRTHVHAAAACAEIHGRADDRDAAIRSCVTAACDTACADTGWFRARGRARRSTPPRARHPCRTRRAEQCRTSADRDTS